MKKINILIISILCYTISFGQSITIPPKTNQYINDFAGVIPDEKESELTLICSEQQRKSSAQIVVVTTNDIPDDYPIAEYSQELFEKWGIGQAGIDNGVLIVVFPNQRKSRVHVGYGLEGALTDGYTKTAQKTHLNPYFKEGDYFGGLQSLMLDISKKIDPEAIAQQKEFERLQAEKRAKVAESVFNWIINILIIGVIVGLLIYAYRREKRKQRKRLEEEEHQHKMKLYAEAEAKRLELEIIRKQKQYIHSVRTQMDELKSFYKEREYALVAMANKNFSNAQDLLSQHQLYKDVLNLNFSETTVNMDDVKAIESKCVDVHKKLTNLSDGLVQNWTIFNFVTARTKEQETILNSQGEKLQLILSEMGKLNTSHGTRIWQYKNRLPKFNYDPSDVINRWTKIVTEIKSNTTAATEYLSLGNYKDAKIRTVDADSLIVSLTNIEEEVFTKQTQIDEASNFIKKNMLTLTKTMGEVTKLVNDPIVDSYTQFKSNYKTQINNYNLTDFTSSKLGVLDRHNMLMEFLDFLKNSREKAEKIIAAYHAKIRAEEEDAERERLRKKRQQEEEEHRRQQDSYSSSSSYYSSSSSSYDSGSSSSSDFGGGSSGGGGSDNSW